jgi:hypothetical protein
MQAGAEQLPESREDDGSGRTFVESPSTRDHLRNLARALLLRKYPILLQVHGLPPPSTNASPCMGFGSCSILGM